MVVRPDRKTVTGLLILQTVAALLIIPANVLQLSDESGWGLALRVATIVFWAVFFAFQAVVWGRFLTAEALAEIGPSGIRVNHLARGWVSLPWDAVATVRKDLWGRIVVKPAEGVDRSTPGTEWPSSRWTAWWARRQGPMIVPRVSDTGAANIRAAIAHFSGGRL